MAKRVEVALVDLELVKVNSPLHEPEYATINGFEIASPEKALEAYARLRTASRLRVQLNRAGKPIEINLHII